MSGLSNGFAQLFKGWGKGIGKAVDNYLLDAEARKAISDEVGKKFQSKIDLAHTAESRRADNIKDLGDKVTQSKQKLADDQKAWKDKYAAELAGAKNQRQTEIDNYKAQSQAYQKAIDDAKANKENIVDQLRASEANYDLYRTLYTDVKTGDKYIFNLKTGAYEPLNTYISSFKRKKQSDIIESIKDYDNRLIDIKSGNVINAFDKSADKNYGKYGAFNAYKNRAQAQQYIALRDADNNISKARGDLRSWTTNNLQPQTWGKKNLNQFEQDFKSKNGELPTEYSFNGKTYQDATALDSAYQKALNHAQYKRDYFRNKASNYASERDKEIAQRIQDAKDIKKAKLALGAGAGAGALYAGARAMYGGDDTDNTNNTDNIDNGKPDPNINIANTPEGQALLNDEQPDTAPIDTGFDPDKADALASAAYAKGVEDGNSIESSGDLGNNIAASTGGHTIDDGLFELLKAMQDPHKADAVANYIYSRHGDDPDVQRLGWRAWLNKYYGDSLRSMMNIDPSGYNGMHVSGGL